MRTATLAVLLLVTATVASGSEIPDRLRLGSHSVRLAGKATRQLLFGLIDVYTIALYTENGKLQANMQVSGRMAVRVLVHHDTRSDGIPQNWRDELKPDLSRSDLARLDRAYSKLKAGDVVEIRYVPAKGTSLLVNSRTIFHTANRVLMQAFVDMWLGNRPVSDDVKRGLLGQ